MSQPSESDLVEAFGRIRSLVHETPVMTCHSLEDIVRTKSGCFKSEFALREGEEVHLLFKCELFQKVGAFKARGAMNAVFSLGEDECKRGVCTHSSGNHGAALALAAAKRGIAAHIVMPSNSARVKKDAVAGYGGRVVECKPTLQAREDTLKTVMAETGAILVHPYDDYQVICGQSTLTLEFILQTRKVSLGDVHRPLPPGGTQLDILLCPVGGGGLLSGTLLAVKYFSPKTKVYAIEPKGADDAYQSWKSKKFVPQTNPQTVADGLRTSLGSKTFPIIMELVHEIVPVEEKSIVDAMKLLWQRLKVTVEPSSAVPFAALLEGKIDVRNKTVGILLCGGNTDLDALPWAKL